MSWLHLITHNIPWFIRAPAIALLGSECYTNLIYNVQLDEIYCLKYGISKFLSLAIVFGSGIVKVPQIIKILQSRSARGLSLAGFLLDSLGLVIIVCYNYRHDFPFSTYGESFLLLIQNTIIVTLIILSSRYPKAGLLSFLAISTPALLLGITLVPNSPVPASVLQGLLTLSIPLALSSKIPQIMINFQKKSTGQLSSFLIFSSFLGCLARLFTTLTETGDLTLLINFSCGSILNGILALQLISYWNESSNTTGPNLTHPAGSRNSSTRLSDSSENRSSDPMYELNELRRRSSSSRPSSPLSKSPSSSSPTINLNSPRQWTRKAD
ncbi:hypothetical protein PGT21_032712 [Puccinia graminis f. sp. tritici]|uniref:Mannose-P-dolichol utilization defect 1 protein homolog n=2 Tax=Puccinia graminis f. sp. tritici TaxID=56615 RepID=E3KAL2_PUCGT|nr:uncharacterized protein PGTG_07045 [Puccinia graminis f. sp. tritici CRL 75-36-700-3]EFP81424.2 hypothetical protein PGTG_07045 [Puccinia graminis f. sp. tritici CRL 75-36-700-3]KAA1109079.1 hypothetical protein PGT21_032712 [Puccinia graminis f. sp. tritici]